MNRYNNSLIVKMIRRHGKEKNNMLTMKINDGENILVYCKKCMRGSDSYCKIDIENYKNWKDSGYRCSCREI